MSLVLRTAVTNRIKLFQEKPTLCSRMHKMPWFRGCVPGPAEGFLVLPDPYNYYLSPSGLISVSFLPRPKTIHTPVLVPINRHEFISSVSPVNWPKICICYVISAILHLLQMSQQLGVGVLSLLCAGVDGVIDAVELVPHVRGARLHQRIHVAAKFH